jgi:hypothetical protein
MNVARTLYVCGVETCLDAYLGLGINHKQASRRVSTLQPEGRATTDYFASKMKVGATPDKVEKPDGPTAVSQLEQPCTFPR